MCLCFFALEALPGSFFSNTETNCHALQVLKGAVERIIRTPDDPEPSAEVPLGLYLVRGDNVCSVGLVDETLDESIDWTQVKGTVIGGIKHI